MPAPPIMDLGSGINTQEVIQKLLRVERVPIERVKAENEKSKVYIKAWEEAKKRADDLQDKSRKLYSFTGPFHNKVVESSEPGAITGQAAGHVEDANQSIHVKRLATRHRIHSDPVSSAEEIPAGQFTLTVDGKEHNFRFPGGGLRDLVSLIERKESDSFEVYRINMDGENSILGLRSKVTGEKGSIQADDPDGLLTGIGLFGDRAGAEAKKWELSFQGSRLRTVQGYPQITEDSKSMNLSTASQVIWNQAIKEMQILRFDLDKKTPPKKQKQKGDESDQKQTRPDKSAQDSKDEKFVTKHETSRMGPDIRFHVEGVELEGGQIKRSRDRKIRVDLSGGNKERDSSPGGFPSQPPGGQQNGQSSLTLVLEAEDGTTRQKRIPLERSGPVELDPQAFSGEDFSGSIRSIQFDSGSSELSINEPVLVEKEEGYGPLHVEEDAGNALLSVNGVEVERSDNEEITDIIDGVSLNLHRTTAGPVDVSIHSDTDRVIETIQEWVTSYNGLMKFIRENSKPSSEEEFNMSRPDRDKNRIGAGLDALEMSKGIFASDSTALRIVNTLREATSRAYPSRMEPAYTILSDIGITTGKPGSNWESNRYGYLDINETRLREAIATNPMAVKELFASDTDSNMQVDNGVAYHLYDQMRAFTSMSGGLITVRIDLIKNKIADNKKRIDKMELSLEDKEERLRQKFGRMERAIRESKQTGNFVQSRIGGK